MLEYFIVSISLVVISSILLMIYLNKRKMFKKSTVQAIITSTFSIISMSVLFPFIVGYLMNFTVKFNDSASFMLGIGLAVVITLTIYFGAILLLSVFVSKLLLEDNICDEKSRNGKNNLITRFFNMLPSSMCRLFSNRENVNGLGTVTVLENQSIKDVYQIQRGSHVEVISENELKNEGQDSLKAGLSDKLEISAGITQDCVNNSQTIDLQGAVRLDENILQKPVDREQNTDTIGVETDSSGGIVTGENIYVDPDKAEEPVGGISCGEMERPADEKAGDHAAEDQKTEAYYEANELITAEAENGVPVEEESGVDENGRSLENDVKYEDVAEEGGKDLKMNTEGANSCNEELWQKEENELKEETAALLEKEEDAAFEADVIEDGNIKEAEEIKETAGPDTFRKEVEELQVRSEGLEEEAYDEFETGQYYFEEESIEKFDSAEAGKAQMEENIADENNVSQLLQKSEDMIFEGAEDTDKSEDIEDCEFGSENGVLNEYIDEAFNLKAGGDFEGAILNYMYALEYKPENELVFWLVLDICALYKQLGKADLAKSILEGYIIEYGSVMSENVRNEIEKNL